MDPEEFCKNISKAVTTDPSMLEFLLQALQMYKSNHQNNPLPTSQLLGTISTTVAKVEGEEPALRVVEPTIQQSGPTEKQALEPRGVYDGSSSTISVAHPENEMDCCDISFIDKVL
jgi:hypothetical protein